MSFVPLAALPIAAVLWFGANRLLFRDIFSPFALLFVSWITPLLLQAMNLSTLEQPWGLEAALITGWVTFGMAGTCVLAALLVPRDGVGPTKETFERALAATRSPIFLAAFFACYAITFAVYLYAEFFTNPYGVPLLAVLSGPVLPPSNVHRWGKDTGLAAITALLWVLTPAAYVAYRGNRGNVLRAVLLGLALLFPVMGVLKLSRGDVFVAVVTLVLAAEYYRSFTRESAIRGRIFRYGSIAVVSILAYYVMMTVRPPGGR